MTVTVNEPLSLPTPFVAVQSIWCAPIASVTGELTGVLPIAQAIVGVGTPVAVTVNDTEAVPEPCGFSTTEKSAGTPDLKVYVNADPSAPKSKPKFYSAAQVEEIQSELTEARAAVALIENGMRVGLGTGS